MSEGDKVWFTDPDGDLSSGLYTIDRICGEVYSLSNDDGAVEAFEHELKVCFESDNSYSEEMQDQLEPIDE